MGEAGRVDAPVMLSRNRRHFKKRPHRGARVGVGRRGGEGRGGTVQAERAPAARRTTLSISSYFIDIGGGPFPASPCTPPPPPAPPRPVHLSCPHRPTALCRSLPCLSHVFFDSVRGKAGLLRQVHHPISRTLLAPTLPTPSLPPSSLLLSLPPSLPYSLALSCPYGMRGGPYTFGTEAVVWL